MAQASGETDKDRHDNNDDRENTKSDATLKSKKKKFALANTHTFADRQQHQHLFEQRKEGKKFKASTKYALKPAVVVNDLYFNPLLAKHLSLFYHVIRSIFLSSFRYVWISFGGKLWIISRQFQRFPRKWPLMVLLMRALIPDITVRNDE